MTDEHDRSRRLLNSVLGWVVFVIYAAAAIFVLLTWAQWPNSNWFLIGPLILIAYVMLVHSVWWLLLIRSHKMAEPTEWMKRGGLMAAPEQNAQPDEARIRQALAMLHDDVFPHIAPEIETYLAMPDDDEKQLQRDRLISKYYEQASSSKDDYAHRAVYNCLRRALKPWTDTE